jgi:hypothetical protein
MEESEIKHPQNRSPELVIAGDCIYVNTASLKLFTGTENVMIGVDADNLKVILRPCRDGEYEAVRWRSAKLVSSVPRHIFSRDLADRLFILMNRPRERRYKIAGSVAESDGEKVLLFDLTAAVPYVPAKAAMDTNKIINSQEDTQDDPRPNTELAPNSGVVS